MENNFNQSLLGAHHNPAYFHVRRGLEVKQSVSTSGRGRNIFPNDISPLRAYKCASMMSENLTFEVTVTRANPATPSLVINDKPSAGEPIPTKCAVIEVHIGELKQLFNSIDPSPFRNRDLDPKAEEFIVDWAKDVARDSTLALLVDLDRQAGLPDEAAVLRDAIHQFFRQRAEGYRRR